MLSVVVAAAEMHMRRKNINYGPRVPTMLLAAVVAVADIVRAL